MSDLSPWEELISIIAARLSVSTLEGVINTVLFCPLSRARVMLQTRRTPPPHVGNYKTEDHLSIVDPSEGDFQVLGVCGRTVRNQGLAAMWKGSLAQILKTIKLSMVNLGVMEVLTLLIEKLYDSQLREKGGLDMSPLVFIAMLATVSSAEALATTPFRAVFTRCAVDSGTVPKYKNSIDCALKMVNEPRGWRSFFTGASCSIFGSILQKSLYVLSSVLLGTALGKVQASPSFTLQVVNIFSLTVPHLIIYPFDTVQRRMVVDEEENPDKEQPAFIDKMSSIVQTEGFSSLYRGYLVNQAVVLGKNFLSLAIQESILFYITKRLVTAEANL